MFGTVVFVLLAILAVVGPRWIAQWGYTEVDRGHYLQSPSTRHWLGTTQDGRDLFALSIRGLGKSMIIGLSVAILSTTMSAVVGSFAAYFSGWFERVSLWVIDLLLVLPVVHHHRRAGAQRQPGQQHLAADRAADLARLDAHGARRAQPHDVGARPRLRHGRQVHGRRRAEDRVPPHHPQHLVAADRRRHGRRGGRRARRDRRCRSSASASGRPRRRSARCIGQGARQATTFPWIFYAGAIPLVLLVLSVNFMGDGLRDALDPTSRRRAARRERAKRAAREHGVSERSGWRRSPATRPMVAAPRLAPSSLARRTRARHDARGSKVRRTTSGTVLSVTDLGVNFPSEPASSRAVRGVSFDLAAGEVLGDRRRVRARASRSRRWR